MNLGRAIKELRKEQGLSQEELALASSITQAALSQIENGKRPGSGTLNKISKALKVPVSLIYALGMDKEDVPKGKRVVYDQLFPIVQNLIIQIGSK
ncbi:MAG: helix-turn-helix domain-containing protein [Flavisolibacter sp.]